MIRTDYMTFDPMAFDLSIPEHAYFFGLLLADGSVSSGPGKKGKIVVELGEVDRELLVRLQEIIPLPISITERHRDTNFKKDYKSSVLTITRLEAREHLINLGLPVGAKAMTAAVPTVPFSKVDLLRGLWDGDGSLGMTAKGYPFVAFVTKSESLKDFVVEAYLEYADRVRNINRNARDNAYNLSLTTDAAVKFAGTLYYPGCLALERKARSAATISAWVRPPGMRAGYKSTFWDDAQDDIVLNSTIEEAMEKLSRTEKSVKMRKFRLQKFMTGKNRKEDVPKY